MEVDECYQLDLPGVGEITAYRSTRDGALVVEIDTDEATAADGTAHDDGTPRLRVYVNDSPVWEHPAYPNSPEEGT